eukprot:CAMPEP_0118926952 /NCGR_PEP_ID=MMETSP1169-20130426/4546_1 /TAXON_ID=36882 /ORGANISM="Pyramimonas obovata, Strain CCMP722" /LENGTH=457 /DNA_ID=CAMNT_0006868619 /DNA_START=436 /DNA_END=1805 /DNA_ORIENTATION=-
MNLQARYSGRFAGITHRRGAERFLGRGKGDELCTASKNKIGQRLKFVNPTRATNALKMVANVGRENSEFQRQRPKPRTINMGGEGFEELESPPSEEDGVPLEEDEVLDRDEMLVALAELETKVKALEQEQVEEIREAQNLVKDQARFGALQLARLQKQERQLEEELRKLLEEEAPTEDREQSSLKATEDLRNKLEMEQEELMAELSELREFADSLPAPSADIASLPYDMVRPARQLQACIATLQAVTKRNAFLWDALLKTESGVRDDIAYYRVLDTQISELETAIADVNKGLRNVERERKEALHQVRQGHLTDLVAMTRTIEQTMQQVEDTNALIEIQQGTAEDLSRRLEYIERKRFFNAETAAGYEQQEQEWREKREELLVLQRKQQESLETLASFQEVLQSQLGQEGEALQAATTQMLTSLVEANKDELESAADAIERSMRVATSYREVKVATGG